MSIKNFKLILAILPMAALFACSEEPRNTEELTDPWLRERTPVNLRLESQIGAAVIMDDWRNDAEGAISVSLITSGLDLSAVKVVALDFKYPSSEFCPTADIGPGSTLDFSRGSASFVVTAHNGETRTYTVNYSQFKDELEGSYTFTPIAGILDGSAPQSAFVIVGGWDGEVVMSTLQDKSWHWGDGYQPADEEDNVLSFRLEEADAETGVTYGTLINTAGPDGKYANYMYDNRIDMNDKYRIFPAGKSRWSRPGDGTVVVYAYEDVAYSNPLYTVAMLGAGTYAYDGKDVVIPNMAFSRSFEGPFDNIDWNYPDTRWFTDNYRHGFWLMQKDTDEPLENHSDLLAE